MNEQTERVFHDVSADAEKLRALHLPGDPLRLANIWDPATARLVESTGMRAIATSSAALAPVNGYEDHGKLPPDVTFGALRRIADAVTVPVTADMEDGYGLSAEELVRRLGEAGACGLNIEDTDHAAGGIVDIDQQADRIGAIKSAGKACGFDVVVNARIDVHFHRRSIEEGLQRAKAYIAAGADCIYPIFLFDLSAIRQYVALGPTNVLWYPGSAALGDLVKAGVSRISVGPVLYQRMMKCLRGEADALMRLDESVFADRTRGMQ